MRQQEEDLLSLKDGKGVVFNIQRFSINDGPGIRSTVFLKGCPLCCPWCQNPESIRLLPEIFTRNIKCIRCGKCADICPNGAISMTKDSRNINWDMCNYCLKCVEVCPSKSIELVGEYKTVDEVIEEVMKDSGYYRRTGGGITISGGEPLVQWKFTTALLQKAKQKGVHTAIDTTGYFNWDIMDKVLDYTKLVLYDVKHMDSAKHKKATGVPNEQILENLRKTVKKPGLKVWIRYPLIPSFNDSEEVLDELCAFAAELGPAVEKISLLPFHKFGELKYTAGGRVYAYKDFSVLSDAKVEKLGELIKSNGLHVEIGK